MIITNELNEAYVCVSDYGEATVTSEGKYHIHHAALYEDHFLECSLDNVFSTLRHLDKQSEICLRAQ